VEKKGLDFTVNKSLSTSQVFIKTDRAKFYTILINLVKNAIKYTQRGYIEFGYSKRDGVLEFYVKDTGVGIIKEHQRLIFDRFRQGSELLTRNYEGSGLGLSISKSYVEMLGGKIWVESEIEKGSTFFFTLPYTANNFGRKNSNHHRLETFRAPLTKKLKIVIADDEQTSAMLLAEMLEMYSSKLLFATTGSEAVEICRNNPDIDLVMMDIKMPEMDGYEATRQIRKFNKTIFIVAQTAFGFVEDKERAIIAGCNYYLSKPINGNLFVGLIEKHFNDK